jgi:hypothetical protein
MAMVGNDLGDKIYEAIISPLAPPDVQAQIKIVWEKIGTAIVEYIQENAEVPAGIPVSSGGETSSPGAVT